MKELLLIIILFIFLYRHTVEGQGYRKEEGFSSSEKDIRASYDTQGVLKRDRSGKICKLGENKGKDTKIILEKESTPTDPMDPMSNMDPLNPMSPLFEFNERLNIESDKRESDNVKIMETTDKMRQLEDEELKEIKAITNKLDLLEVNLRHSKEKEKLMNKLIDKIHTGPTYTESPKQNNTHILLFIVLIVTFAVGGVAIYYIMGPSTSDGPLTYKDAVLRAKQNIMKRRNMI